MSDKKVKGIYLMTCAPEQLDESQRTALSAHGLQSLELSDPGFRKINARLQRDQPMFYEAFLQMRTASQPDVVLEQDFRGWLGQRGVRVDEAEWPSHFFHVEKTVPGRTGMETRHMMVYYDV